MTDAEAEGATINARPLIEQPVRVQLNAWRDGKGRHFHAVFDASENLVGYILAEDRSQSDEAHQRDQSRAIRIGNALNAYEHF